MTRDLVIDDPDVTTSPMINPFANQKKKNKKGGGKTPKSTGSNKKGGEMNSDHEDQDQGETFDRRLDNPSIIRIEAL